ncbi:autophagy-related 7 [Corchorus olitorius]|uniref:Autophagy-related 7 n=1 Tax=Corchorus olitorius TaxID=93759 RepID=A0A1R3L1V1_9ROSI|nr:autophagy-related 7 [Corchorus olitorius]
MAFNHWPEIARGLHLPIVIIKLIQQFTARNFEVFQIIAVPDHIHGIHIVKRHLNDNLSLHIAAPVAASKMYWTIQSWRNDQQSVAVRFAMVGLQ